MNKVIHYCWFGPKPIPELAKKCIKSWKKYLPDFEVKICNESNFDINSCEFVKQAYKAGKWAFVSDYARLNALYNDGGIYFDTDMEVLTNIDFLKEKDFFIGREYSGYIAAGVIGVKYEKNEYIKEMLDYYKSIKHFDTQNLFDYAIPKIITKVLNKYEHKTINGIDIYNGNCYVYPVDYFYPMSYDRSTKYYSNKTCMVHYYDATWIPKKEKIILSLYRTLGKSNTKKLCSILRGIKYRFIRINNLSKKGLYYIKKYISINFNSSKRLKRISINLNSLKRKDIVVISNPDYIGVSNSTKELFGEILEIRDVYKEKEAIKIGNEIVRLNPKLVIFSGFSLRWWQIAETIKKINKDIIIKVIWHGGNALLTEKNDFLRFSELLYICNEKIVSQIGFLKESMAEFMKEKGYNTSTLYNIVNIDKDKFNIESKTKDEGEVKIGIYLSRDRWEKNMYNQISSASLISNSKLDIIPLTNKVRDFSRMLKIEIEGNKVTENKQGIYNRLSNNDINMYVTFTECAPLLPLESFELGVPCITGNTHEYWKDTKLEKYLIVDREDDILEIKQKLEYCLENKEEVMKLYNEWKQEYTKKVNIKKTEFLDLSKY